MKITRRDYIKAQAVAAAAAAAGMAVPSHAASLVTQRDKTELTWSKAPCRFCGTGCSVMVATKNGHVVATHGDVKAEVNRGLNCVKGYFLSKIMYGADRLTEPLLRMKDGEYHKEGDFSPVTWERAFDEMEVQFKRVLKEKGPEAVGMFGSGQWTVWEGYAASKLMKAGFRSNNIDPNARHCMASAVAGFMRTFGIDEPMGCYDDFEAADAFVLWCLCSSPCTCRGGRAANSAGSWSGTRRRCRGRSVPRRRPRWATTVLTASSVLPNSSANALDQATCSTRLVKPESTKAPRTTGVGGERRFNEDDPGIR